MRTKEQERIRWRRRKYGIAPNDYLKMCIAQHGKCAICRRPDRRALCVDHDHKTGKIRGLLCTKCNVGLGAFKERITVLRRVIQYIKRHKPC